VRIIPDPVFGLAVILRAGAPLCNGRISQLVPESQIAEGQRILGWRAGFGLWFGR